MRFLIFFRRAASKSDAPAWSSGSGSRPDDMTTMLRTGRTTVSSTTSAFGFGQSHIAATPAANSTAPMTLPAPIFIIRSFSLN